MGSDLWQATEGVHGCAVAFACTLGLLSFD